MNVAVRKSMTADEFLAWEARPELRFEFDGFQSVSIVDGTAAYSAIRRNLLYSLTRRLHGALCQMHGSELKIQVAGHVRHPEAFLVCTPVPARFMAVADRGVVFEVLSDITANDDLVLNYGFSAPCALRPSGRGAMRFGHLQQKRNLSAACALPRFVHPPCLLDTSPPVGLSRGDAEPDSAGDRDGQSYQIACL